MLRHADLRLLPPGFILIRPLDGVKIKLLGRISFSRGHIAKSYWIAIVKAKKITPSDRINLINLHY
ncbi:hypothetical protein M1512_03240 [Patescibacteria group bacterium]|nr:hypothetical protein [Patescibacteria group bacterium]